MSSRGGGGAKRKHSTLSSSGTSGSRAQQKKLASKAAKRSAATTGARRSSSGPSAAEEQQLADSLFFESDDDGDDDGATKKPRNDMLIRDPRRRGGGGNSEDEDDDDGARDEHAPPPEEDPYAFETPDEKRVRLARAFLSKIEADVDEEAGEDGEGGAPEDDEEAALEAEEERRGITRDAAIDRKLKANLAAQQGKLKAFVAHARYDASSFPVARAGEYSRHLGGHNKGGATCITMTDDCSTMYTGGKDCNLAAWDTETGKKLYTLYGNRGGKYGNVDANRDGHQDVVLSVSVSSDGAFLASGSKDQTVKIWDPRAGYKCVKTFAGAHKAAVSAVAFRMGSHQLFTGSYDRTIRIYNVDQLAYVETLYGHTSEVTALDSLWRERCLSVSQDKTARLWKVPEETQLMFRASTFAESLDALAMLNEEQFITGGQDGTVCAWINTKKKPTSVLQQAHGGKWISSVGAQRFTDVCFSGSSDGYLNLYCLESKGRETNKLNLMHRVPVAGYINGMVSDARDGRFVALAVGQEHRLGRWDPQKGARSGVMLVSLAGVDRVRDEAAERAADDDERKDGEANDEDEDEDEMDGDEAMTGAGAPKRPVQREEEPRFAVPSNVPSIYRPAEDKRGGRGGGRGGSRGGRGGGGRGGGSSRGGSSRGGSSRGGGRGRGRG